MKSKYFYLLVAAIGLAGLVGISTSNTVKQSFISKAIHKANQANKESSNVQAPESAPQKSADTEASKDTDMAELEKISDELMAYKAKFGDDPEKMTTKELEDQVTLMNAYNKQLHIVLKNVESSL